MVARRRPVPAAVAGSFRGPAPHTAVSIPGMSTDVVAKRAANALIEDAALGIGAVRDVLPGTSQVDAVLAGYKQAHGGLWVGGRAELTTGSVRFRANALNRVVQTGTLSFEVPLGAVVGVEVRPAFVTRIIAIRTAQSVVKIRCYRADAFAKQITDQVEALRRGRG